MSETITPEELDDLARVMRLSRETVPIPEVLERAAATIRELEKRAVPEDFTIVHLLRAERNRVLHVHGYFSPASGKESFLALYDEPEPPGLTHGYEMHPNPGAAIRAVETAAEEGTDASQPRT